jgi:hypothetical protein
VAAYFYGVVASTAGANKRHLAVFNPVGSGVVLTVFHVQASGAPTAAVTGLTIGLSCHRITSAPTGGTDVVALMAVTAEGAPVGGIVAKAAATGGAAELATPFGCGVVSGEETSAANESVLYSAVAQTNPLRLVAGEGFVVKQGALASAGAINLVAKVAVS